MKKTYMIPIWIDVSSRHPQSVIMHLNSRLEEFFEDYAEENIRDGDNINIQWSINEHISLK